MSTDPLTSDSTVNTLRFYDESNTLHYRRSTLPNQGMLPAQSQTLLEDPASVVLQKAFKLKGYNGSSIIPTKYDFQQKYKGILYFKDADILYDDMMTDIKLLPNVLLIKNYVTNTYLVMLPENLNAIHRNAPKFFKEMFIDTPIGFELYQKYYLILVLINFIDKHRDDTELKQLKDFHIYLSWIASRKSESIDFILRGPMNNQAYNINFRSHYSILISPSNEMTNVLDYQQLVSTQSIDTSIQEFRYEMAVRPNVYDKTVDGARSYVINVRYIDNVSSLLDDEKRLVFDCTNVDLGNPFNDGTFGKFDELTTEITTNEVHSRINIDKIRRIFNEYSRVSIKKLALSEDDYVTKLDSFETLYVVFPGIFVDMRYSLSSSNTFNSSLAIPGHFTKSNGYYEFHQHADAMTYRKGVDVKNFKFYISPSNGDYHLLSKELNLVISKWDVYQAPITTGVTKRAPTLSFTNDITTKVNRQIGKLHNERRPAIEEKDVTEVVQKLIQYQNEGKTRGAVCAYASDLVRALTQNETTQMILNTLSKNLYSLAIREQWYANGLIDLTDDDLTAMFTVSTTRTTKRKVLGDRMKEIKAALEAQIAGGNVTEIDVSQADKDEIKRVFGIVYGSDVMQTDPNKTRVDQIIQILDKDDALRVVDARFIIEILGYVIKTNDLHEYDVNVLSDILKTLVQLKSMYVDNEYDIESTVENDFLPDQQPEYTILQLKYGFKVVQSKLNEALFGNILYSPNVFEEYREFIEFLKDVEANIEEGRAEEKSETEIGTRLSETFTEKEDYAIQFAKHLQSTYDRNKDGTPFSFITTKLKMTIDDILREVKKIIDTGMTELQYKNLYIQELTDSVPSDYFDKKDPELDDLTAWNNLYSWFLRNIDFVFTNDYNVSKETLMRYTYKDISKYIDDDINDLCYIYRNDGKYFMYSFAQGEIQQLKEEVPASAFVNPYKFEKYLKDSTLYWYKQDDQRVVSIENLSEGKTYAWRLKNASETTLGGGYIRYDGNNTWIYTNSTTYPPTETDVTGKVEVIQENVVLYNGSYYTASPSATNIYTKAVFGTIVYQSDAMYDSEVEKYIFFNDDMVIINSLAISGEENLKYYSYDYTSNDVNVDQSAKYLSYSTSFDYLKYYWNDASYDYSSLFIKRALKSSSIASSITLSPDDYIMVTSNGAQLGTYRILNDYVNVSSKSIQYKTESLTHLLCAEFKTLTNPYYVDSIPNGETVPLELTAYGKTVYIKNSNGILYISLQPDSTSIGGVILMPGDVTYISGIADDDISMSIDFELVSGTANISSITVTSRIQSLVEYAIDGDVVMRNVYEPIYYSLNPSLTQPTSNKCIALSLITNDTQAHPFVKYVFNIITEEEVKNENDIFNVVLKNDSGNIYKTEEYEIKLASNHEKLGLHGLSGASLCEFMIDYIYTNYAIEEEVIASKAIDEDLYLVPKNNKMNLMMEFS